MSTESETSNFRDHDNESLHDLKPGDKFAYTVVASIGGAGDWAAYYSRGDKEYTASHGEKLDEGTATKLFPRLSHLRYRR